MWATLDAVRGRLPAHVEDPQACETPNEKSAKVCVGCLVVNCYLSSTASQSWHTSDTLELTVWVALLYGGSLSPRSESLYGSSISLGKRCSVAARFHRGSSALWPLAFTGEALLCGRSLSPGKFCSVAARFHRGSVALWPLAFTGEALLCGRSLSQGKRCSVAARFHRGSVALWPLAFALLVLLLLSCIRVPPHFPLFRSHSLPMFPPFPLPEGGWGRLMSSPAFPVWNLCLCVCVCVCVWQLGGGGGGIITLLII